MKCAIVNDSIVEYGGAEIVLNSLLKIFPKADIYTLVADEVIINKKLPRINNSKLNIVLPSILNNRGSIIQLFTPIVWPRINLDKYELVIANSSHLMSNMVNSNSSVIIQYILSLPKNIFGFSEKYRLQKYFMYDSLLKYFYLNALRKSQHILTDSIYTKETLKNLFNVYSDVIYPPVKIPSKLPKKNKGDYYLSVSRINKFKKLEIIIEAFNRLGLPLKIVGSGNEPHYEYKLRHMAGKQIEFLGYVSDKKLNSLYLSATAIVCSSSNEDFGIAAVEAQGYGIPVIAFNGGGFHETVIPGKTGLFFNELNVDSLIYAIKKFSKMKFNPVDCWRNAKKYNSIRFEKEMKEYILNVLNSKS